MFGTVLPQKCQARSFTASGTSLGDRGLSNQASIFAHYRTGKAPYRCRSLIGCSTCNPASAHPDLELYPIAAVQ